MFCEAGTQLFCEEVALVKFHHFLKPISNLTTIPQKVGHNSNGSKSCFSGDTLKTNNTSLTDHHSSPRLNSYPEILHYISKKKVKKGYL